MTHRTTASHNPTAVDDVAALSVSRRDTLAALLAQDEVVRPELTNAAILGAQRASRGPRPADCASHTLSGRP
ncbi:hypothetical protein [Halomonas rhizosphaerae]|uniref:Uncharacterized protein n=1 Tax=Halomonas rhizosphaerae TaxID=3043296 RepID=A0ABT6V7K8_9GAMM|nr:hypothetical protein [Halomonas rhizosphaerae]MDI5893179.1 hypothetical protein [Halomonas rhizosphaerae]